MSDLISRSELLKRFSVSKDGHRMPEKDCDNFEVTVSVKDVKTIIKEQPTAYDIGKVVSELETDSSVKLYGSQNSDNYMIPVKRAIEIVKQGGVSDDVCEWKQDEGCVGLGAYNISCCNKTLEMPVSTARGLKYCTYCGKKIKVVE